MKKLYTITLLITAATVNMFAQLNPGSGGTATCANCSPTGWALEVGSPDVSNSYGWGFTNNTPDQSPWEIGRAHV